MDKPINPIPGSVLMRREEIPMRDRIMDCLVSSSCEAWLSGEKLSAKFGISRAAVSKHIMTLREEGNIIESVPRRGYRLIARADPWAGTDVQEGLKTHTLGQTGWIWLKETGSTNQVAVLEALGALKFPCTVELYTDSQYVAKAIKDRWLIGWQKNGWVNSAKKPVKNQDLWKRMPALLERHDVRFHWLKGHAGHAENERCDELARAEAAKKGLPDDTGFME